jgi:hypothetical protein
MDFWIPSKSRDLDKIWNQQFSQPLTSNQLFGTKTSSNCTTYLQKHRAILLKGGQVKKRSAQDESEDVGYGEVFNPNYHDEYFDTEEINEYGEDEEDKESNYLNRDLWDEESFDKSEEWFFQ